MTLYFSRKSLSETKFLPSPSFSLNSSLKIKSLSPSGKGAFSRERVLKRERALCEREFFIYSKEYKDIEAGV